MRIAVIYDAAADREAAADVAGVLESVRAVTEALLSAGHAAFPVPFGLPLDRSLSRLARVDLVFNLAESVGGRAEGEAAVAALLELAGVPFTGSGSETLALCRRKDRTNSILAAAGLPVPPWALERPGDAPEWARFRPSSSLRARTGRWESTSGRWWRMPWSCGRPSTDPPAPC
jgi:D-alanine-D-alanine ligase-like ATP-grasp enzyme